MHPSIKGCPNLTDLDRQRLQQVEHGMAIAADVSRADVLLFCRQSSKTAVIVAQAQPHSISPLHPTSRLGEIVRYEDEPLVLRALNDRQTGHREKIVGVGAPVIQEVYPVLNDRQEPIGAFVIETNLIERERHRRRSRMFQKALTWFQQMAIRGDLSHAQPLTPFGEWDGIVVTDVQRRIVYLSGVAMHLYRHLGYLEDLRGRRLGYLQTHDDELVATALRTGLCQRWEGEEQDRYIVRQVIPLLRYDPPYPLPGFITRRMPPQERYRRPAGALILVHDDTEPRRRQQELNVQRAMVQEIHHRVKNNLQNIAAVLRLQARRCETQEAREQLEEAVNRILSVAVIHDYLAHERGSQINIREVFQRIINQTEQVALDPGKQIRIELKGPSVYLHKDQATACALVFNELLLNALEHGFNGQDRGQVQVQLSNIADQVVIQIKDDGSGLPEGFSLDQTRSLGLRIVQTLVQDDLRGRFSLYEQDGVVAEVAFPKLSVGGE